MRTFGLILLIVGLSTGCGPQLSGLDASIAPGCFLDYDGGAVGSADQVLPTVTAAAKALKPGLVMIGLQGKLSPDGTDVGGGWTFTFGSPTIAGLLTVQPFATHTTVAGDCGLVSAEPSIRNFKIDSPQALAIAVDAGCVLGTIVPVKLAGYSDSSSPLFDIDPAWLINGSVGRSCVVDANTGAFGIPVDGGVADGGAPDGGDAG